jgi:ABC-type phosphate transport system substrate-binding protein
VAVVAAGGGLDDEIGGAALDYEAVGSQSGIQRVKALAVDFAVSEMPLPAADLRRHGLVQVPLVAVAVHLESQAAAELRLSPGLLADIFLGRVKTWADPSTAQLNPLIGDWPRIALGVGFMCVFVVGLKRCVWRRLYHLAETKYRLGS